MSNKTLRGNTDIFVAYPEAFADRNAPTAAELNDDDFVTLISCAVNDDYKLNRTDSDTDNTQSVCDVAAVETPTFDKYEGALNIFSDEDQADAGVFNRARDLFKNKGISTSSASASALPRVLPSPLAMLSACTTSRLTIPRTLTRRVLRCSWLRVSSPRAGLSLSTRWLPND